MKLKGCIFLITANAFWGLAFPMVKMVSSEAPPRGPFCLSGISWRRRSFWDIFGRHVPSEK